MVRKTGRALSLVKTPGHAGLKKSRAQGLGI